MNIQFKSLTTDSFEEIDSFLAKYEPYSDYSLLSLFTYNTQDTIEYGFHNNNLVVKFEDYDDNSNFYSFLGTNDVLATINLLIEHSIKLGVPPQLKLVPAVVIESTPDIYQYYDVSEDRDNFDYIVSASDVGALTMEEFPKKRKLVDRFVELYPTHSVRTLDLSSATDQEMIHNLFDEWVIDNNKNQDEATTELTAINRLMYNSARFKGLYALGIFDQNKLIAFNTFEQWNPEFGISSFQKANRRYEGIYAFLTQQMAIFLSEKGCKYINFEQDLGIVGLRSSKLSWHPVKYLKKYTISSKI